MKHPVDCLFGGIFLSVIVTVLVMVLLALLPLDALGEGRLTYVLAGMGVSACIVFPRPLLKRTLWHGRDPFVLDDELDNMLIGRGIGLVCGAAAGVFVLGQFI
ncbi:hypothetical protein [Cupriavidus sp. D384]|uniref:hypothetical protein n=1 Tax=Cupriavidus sp. D384 TaxID=1538095 RepID=UPI000836463F|nr:hypothetical protein [Cupriavidus sp. D384]